MYHRCRMRWCPSSLLQPLRCVRLRSCTRRGKSRLPLWIRELWAYMRVLVRSLYFNTLTDSDVVFDSVFEPVFWTVDYVTRWFGTVSVCFCLLYQLQRVFLCGKLTMSDFCLCLVGVCMSGGDPDQLYCHDSLYSPSAFGPQHVLPCMDRLAHLLWTLEPRHDCFPLLQGSQDFPWMPPYSEITITRLCKNTCN